MIKVLECEPGKTPYGPSKKLLVEWQGKEYKTTIFPKFMNFANVGEGTEIEGTIIKNDKNYWEIITETYRAADPYTTRGGASGSNKSHPAMTYQKEVSKSVAKAQDNTSHSVRISSTLRDAVLIAIARGAPTDKEILEIRKWLWKHWDDPDTDAIYPE